MQKLRSSLLRTELLFLVLVAQLLRPVESVISTLWLLYIAKAFLFLVSRYVLLIIPWWRITIVFFADWELTEFEKFTMSIALSLSLLFFSAWYSRILWIPLYPWVILVVTGVWTLVWIIASFYLANRNTTSTSKEE